MEVSESISHDNDTNVTAENDTLSLLHLQEDPDISSQQVDHNQVTVAIDNQSIFAAKKKKLGKKKVKEKETYSISLNGLAIPEINRPGKPEENILEKRCIKHFKHDQKQKKRKSNRHLVWIAIYNLLHFIPTLRQLIQIIL